jgi:hypothetical protein
MKIEQRIWTEKNGWIPEGTGKSDTYAQLVLFFGDSRLLKDRGKCDLIKKMYPNAHYFGCSTAGEICGTQVFDDSIVVTAVSFESTEIRGACVELKKSVDSFDAGKILAESLQTEGLRHVITLSDGTHVNGSALAEGLAQHLPGEVSITGGLAGDGERFSETLVCWDCTPQGKKIAVLGLYGDQIRIGYGSQGGWDPFGPERLITKSEGNVLYELDGKSSLELYKKYLGEHAAGLPAAGLLFPLSLRTEEGQKGVVRTILSIDERRQSMTFAGDIPEGSYARLMMANMDRLIDGAVGAAKTGLQAIVPSRPELAILISCVGRKMVLKQRTEEEVEGVRDVLGDATFLTGFYSYGELCPFTAGTRPELHNQTMTITVLSEK